MDGNHKRKCFRAEWGQQEPIGRPRQKTHVQACTETTYTDHAAIPHAWTTETTQMTDAGHAQATNMDYTRRPHTLTRH